jgi:hypothetical protein
VIGKANGKSWHSIGNPAVNVEAGTSVRLKVVAKDSHFSVFVGTNPQPVYEFTDSDYARGTIGVREYGASFFSLDNVVAHP